MRSGLGRWDVDDGERLGGTVAVDSNCEHVTSVKGGEGNADLTVQAAGRRKKASPCMRLLDAAERYSPSQ